MRTLFFFCLLPFLFTSCSMNTALVDFDRATFERERAAWEASCVTNYAVTESFSSSTFGSCKARITVRDDVIVEKENLFEWELENPESIGPSGPLAFRYVKTVSEVYDDVLSYIEEFLSRADGSMRLSIDIGYDTTLHFPVKVRYSVSSTTRDTLDGGGFSMNLSDFTVLSEE